jgi:membrane peptidoglycan carboxypeptidase
MRRLLRALAIVLVTALAVPIATGGTVLAAFLFLPLPAVLPEAKEGVTAQISRIFDINGNEIGQFRQFETTRPVAPEDIPQVLKDAVIAAEDRRFYDHGGVDIVGTIRALWTDLRTGRAAQGGSTITQQYVKNAYVGNERSLSRKVREAVLAAQLDRQLEKEEILFQYLSNTYFGEGAHGVGAAAETYFRKRVNDLTISEAAMLVGVIPAPSRYEPRGNPALAEQKRKIVLNAMLEEGYIDQAQHDAAAQEIVWLAGFVPPPPGQPVTLVHPRLEERTPFPYFVDYVRRYIEAKYGEGSPYSLGLEIYTTLDPEIQRAAEEEVARSLEGTGPHPDPAIGPLEMSLVSIEPGSGYVKALVGGRDFYAEGGQVNLALGRAGGGSGRQAGSTYKPFVLAEAIEQGVKPSKTYNGRSPVEIAGHEFENYGGSSYGTISLAEATKRSVNTVYVQLIRDVGVDRTMALSKRLGLLSVPEYDASKYGVSVALGALDTAPIELASAYGVWAARGERAVPTPIVRILDNKGVLLEDHTQPTRERIVKEVTADTMNEVMQGVFTPGGTANGKGLKGRAAAGKTGTTQENRDALFIGYTPNLSTAVWIGYRNKPATLSNIAGVRSVTGGTIPAATWQRFMERAHEGLPVVEFSEPAPITEVADEAKEKARGGFDVGERFTPRGTDDSVGNGEPLPPPTVDPPPSTTTTTTPFEDDDPIFGVDATDDG